MLHAKLYPLKASTCEGLTGNLHAVGVPRKELLYIWGLLGVPRFRETIILRSSLLVKIPKTVS